MMPVKDLLTELGQQFDFQVYAVTAKGNFHWIGLMIGGLCSTCPRRTIEILDGYDAHITLGYFDPEEPLPNMPDMKMYRNKLDKVVGNLFGACVTTTIKCSEKPNPAGLREDGDYTRTLYYIEMLIRCEMYQTLCKLRSEWRPPGFQWKKSFHVLPFLI